MNTRKLTFFSLVILVLAAGMVVIILLFPRNPIDREIADTADKTAVGNADLTLVILTDLHYDPGKEEPSTLRPTFRAVSSIMDELKKRGKQIDAVWNLGDFINGHHTNKAEAKAQIQTVLSVQGAVSENAHNIMGNHDNNIQATWNDPSQPETEILTPEELNELLENKNTVQTEIHNSERVTDYYVDFDTIRVICLSADYTTFLPETTEWFQTTALDTEKEVMILSHIPTRPEWGFKNDVVGGEAIEAVIRAFIDRGGRVIAYIHGHDHGDMIRKADGWTSVAIGCARFQVPTSNGTPGMTYQERNEKDETMLLFDVISIDQQTQTVRFIRFGAGEDREIRYGQKATDVY